MTFSVTWTLTVDGLAATFMAKPFAGIPGSGLHIHVSLLDEDGNNVFAGTCSAGAFAETLRHAIGGLAETMAESMAIFAICRREESNRFQTEVSNRDYEWYLRAV